MSNDDSRGLESLDRSHVSPSTTRAVTDGGERTCSSRTASELCPDGGTSENTIRERLESITELTRTLLADIRNSDDHDVLEDVDEPARRDAKRRLREINAEARRVGLLLFGPEVDLPYGSTDDSGDVPAIVRSDSLTTSYLGPAPGAFERVQNAADHRTDPDRGDDSLEGSEASSDASSNRTQSDDDPSHETSDADVGGDRDDE